jgi:hypothetical protein
VLPVFRAGGWLWQGELHGLCTCLWCSDRCCAVLEDACWVMLCVVCVVCVRVFCGGFVNNQGYQRFLLVAAVSLAVFVGGCSLPGSCCCQSFATIGSSSPRRNAALSQRPCVVM